MFNSRNIYNLPYKTEEVLTLNKFEPEKKCQNLGLLLDKYMPKSVFEKSSRQNLEAGKMPWLLEIFRPQNEKEKQNTHIDETFASNAYLRWHKMVESLGADTFELSLDWRMIIGLGGETILETDITLHHLYGIPIVPGSALKGLTRSYAAKENKDYFVPVNKPKEERKPSKKIEDDHPDILRIFGDQEKAGTVCFFDAMPIHGQAQFMLDIMNPHYPEYYNSFQSNNIKVPTNNQQPNPIVFLTVWNTTFTFALAPRNAKYQGDVELVKILLQEALQKYGIGGKTSAGYGYFKEEIQEVSHSSETVQEQITLGPLRPEKKAEPQERIRVNIPQFRIGQDITGSVLTPTDELQQKAPLGAYAFLRYQSYATNDVLIVVVSEEAQFWKRGETRICQLVQQEDRDGCRVLICYPRPSKKKKQ